MVSVSSCDSADIVLTTYVAAGNTQCPMDCGGGLTLEKIEYARGAYVTYTYKGNSSIHTFDQSLVTDEMKTQIVNELNNQAMWNKEIKKFINAMKKKHVGLIYHYYTDNSHMDVIIKPNEL